MLDAYLASKPQKRIAIFIVKSHEAVANLLRPPSLHFKLMPNVAYWQILLQKSVAGDWAVGPFV